MTSTDTPTSTVEFPALRDASRPVHRIATELEPYLRVLVDRVHPEKVILFGSYAYGQPDEHSDVDLLVIRRDLTSEKDSNLEIRRAFREPPGPGIAFTLLSKSPEQLADRLATHSPFYEEIVTRGIVLYAA